MRRLILSLLTTAGCLIAAPAMADDFAITTTAFLDQGPIPVLYTCDSKNISPQLSWVHPPAKTKSFAVTLTDPDAPKGIFYHWIVYNIPANTKELTEGVDKLPANAQFGVNSTGKAGYMGPCPPHGTVHHYIFTFYALDTILPPGKNIDGEKINAAIKGHVLKQVTLTAIYPRWAK